MITQTRFMPLLVSFVLGCGGEVGDGAASREPERGGLDVEPWVVVRGDTSCPDCGGVAAVLAGARATSIVLLPPGPRHELVTTNGAVLRVEDVQTYDPCMSPGLSRPCAPGEERRQQLWGRLRAGVPGDVALEVRDALGNVVVRRDLRVREADRLEAAVAVPATVSGGQAAIAVDAPRGADGVPEVAVGTRVFVNARAYAGGVPLAHSGEVDVTPRDPAVLLASAPPDPRLESGAKVLLATAVGDTRVELRHGSATGEVRLRVVPAR